ncbi:MAG TPA: hypothetical protein VMX97_01175 [Hyphomicrobiaceae bacterium]|nr:hypothetical protein [Hyphomicrobiaceae bacterium]
MLRSIETTDGQRCVDIFIRVDKSFGFEVYRRDMEDARGWFAIGGFIEQRFDTEVLAIHAAHKAAPWVDWNDI